MSPILQPTLFSLHLNNLAIKEGQYYENARTIRFPWQIGAQLGNQHPLT
jgi:hypothetical protein